MTDHFDETKSAQSKQISTSGSETNHPHRMLGGTLVAIAATLWALDGVLRRALYSMPALLVVFYEHLLGAIVLVGVLTWKKEWSSLLKSEKKVWMLSALVGLLSGLVGTYLFTAALQAVNFIPFSVVLLLQKLQPIFAGATAVIFLKEKVTKQYVIWAAAALVSAFFVTFPNGIVNLDAETATLAATLMALGAAIAWGGSTTFSKMLLNKSTVLTATSLRFFWTTLFSLVSVILFASFGTMQLVTPTQTQWLLLGAITVSTGMVALYIYYQGLKRTTVLISTIAELIFPLLAVFIDVFLYKNALLPSQYIAAVFLVISISFVVRSGHTEMAPIAE